MTAHHYSDNPTTISIVERLHAACQQTPPAAATIQTLVAAMPSAARSRSGTDEWLPLHRACRRQPSLPAVRTLVQAWPASVQAWTQDGHTEARLPLHLACQYGASLAVVQYLVQQDPSCVQSVSSPHKMYTALDYALYYYHQRRGQGLNITEAERVVHYLANDALKEEKEEDKETKKEQEAVVEAVVVPTTTVVSPIEKQSLAEQVKQVQEPVETKPHAVVSRPTPPTPRFNYASLQPRKVSNKSSSSSSGKSKIIRIKLPRPAVALR